jgi:hypothetical protein
VSIRLVASDKKALKVGGVRWWVGRWKVGWRANVGTLVTHIPASISTDRLSGLPMGGAKSVRHWKRASKIILMVSSVSELFYLFLNSKHPERVKLQKLRHSPQEN